VVRLIIVLLMLLAVLTFFPRQHQEFERLIIEGYGPCSTIGSSSPKQLLNLSGVERPPYHIEVVDSHQVFVIDDTSDCRWKYFPEIKTKVRICLDQNCQVSYLNYEEYWNDFLLAEPCPDAQLEVESIRVGP